MYTPNYYTKLIAIIHYPTQHSLKTEQLLDDPLPPTDMHVSQCIYCYLTFSYKLLAIMRMQVILFQLKYKHPSYSSINKALRRLGVQAIIPS